MLKTPAMIGALELHGAGLAGELHGGDGVHGDASRTNRVAFGLEAATPVDRGSLPVGEVVVPSWIGAGTLTRWRLRPIAS